MFLAIFCVALAAIFFLYLKWEYSSYVKTIDLIPGPPKAPFFGNALSIPLDPYGKTITILKCFFFLLYRLFIGYSLFLGYNRPNGVIKFNFANAKFETGALQTISVEWPKKYGHFRRGWFGLNGYIDISCPIAAEVRTFYSDIINQNCGTHIS